jgi:hypothetical protein
MLYNRITVNLLADSTVPERLALAASQELETAVEEAARSFIASREWPAGFAFELNHEPVRQPEVVSHV